MKIIIFMLFVAVSEQKDPVSFCENATKVCNTCTSIKECISSDDGYTLSETEEQCISGQNCQNSIMAGECFPLSSNDSDCVCANETCKIDANNANAFVHCDSDGNSELCDSDEIPDINQCKCIEGSASSTTPSTTATPETTISSSTNTPSITDTPSTPITSSSTISETATTLPTNTSPSTISEPTITASSSTSATPSSTETTPSSTAKTPTVITITFSTTATIPTTITPSTTTDFCPECGLKDDPDDDCERFFMCDDQGTLIPVKCETNSCFDQETCLCL